MRSLNLDQLRTLTEVVALGSFSAAARRLNLTQPAVSLQIRELEARWGLRLVERSGKQAQATVPGRELIEHAGTIARACEAAEAAMRRFRDGWLGRVHIGTTLTALTYVLPPVLRGLRTQYPNIDLVLTNMATRDTVEKLLGSEIDFGLVTLPIKPGPFIVTPLRAETCVAILPAGTPNVPDIITPSYVAQQSLVLEHDKGAVHALVMQWLAEHLPLTRRPMYVGIVEAAKQAVASGLGMSIVPDVAVTTALPEIIVRPMKPVLPCTLALVERRNKPAQTVLNVVRSALLELQTPEAAAIDPERRARRATRAQESSAGAEDVDA